VLVAMRRRLHALLFGVPILASIAASAAQLTPLGGGRTDIWLYAPMAFMIASGVDIVLEWVQDSHRRDGPGKRRRSTILRGRDVLFGGSVGLIALVCMFNIPSPSAFPWPDVVPLITELEAGRAPNDLVVVAGPFTFNYALHAPQPFVTRVSNRNATHFTPVVQGVNAMNWQDYSAPVTELRSRVRNVRDVWVIDAPNIAYPFGSAPRNELRHEGFQLVSESRSDGGVLEHWHRQA
jgi:hypothetical protein